MGLRKIIEIDRDSCNGCGLCTKACAEGALELDNEGKAVLIREIFCDGLGACLDVCPTGALKVVERDSEDYNPQITYEHVLKSQGEAAAKLVHGAQEKESPKLACGCPGTMAKEIKKKVSTEQNSNGNDNLMSELSQWPIQLQLVSPQAPYFNKSDLLIAADCTAFALNNFHGKLLKGKKLVIACPKLDNSESYITKIAEIIKQNVIYSLTVAIMIVPCCSGLYRIAEEAVKLSGKDIAIRKLVITLEGDVKAE
ncbi:MAG: 4Fe-4S dicluster domain-containing protein [Candidatus Margulisbacteria bacterium]|nr:4Fe-4S dicluster domain-containing protein [Candidatus Margulisiibacteriota bacterium]